MSASVLDSARRAQAQPALPVEPLLLSTVRVRTFLGSRLLTGATGFFLEQRESLFLVTSRHVLYDEPTSHFPDRIELMVHTDPVNLTRTSTVSLPLYDGGIALWRQGRDSGGEVDVAALPPPVSYTHLTLPTTPYV